MPFHPNFIDPLLDPGRYDDAFGSSFDHALLADYGPIAPDCWVHDAWIVTACGDVHPGLCASPVPVRLIDIDEAGGRPFRSGRVDLRSAAEGGE
jgi:hypothetical protein